MGSAGKWIGVICFSLMTGVALRTLQTRFDRSDLEKSIEHVRNTPLNLPGQPTIEQRILAIHGPMRSGPLEWRGEVESACYGHMNVLARVPLKDGTPVDYQWKTDVIRLTIQPWNEAARSLNPKDTSP